MNEVRPVDRSVLLQSRRAECSSIARSRKRKLRELYSVATDRDAVAITHPKDFDAPPTTQAESHFLLESDLLQGRSFTETRIPKRQTRYATAIQKLLETTNSLAEQISVPPTKNGSKTSAFPPPTSSEPSQSRIDSSEPLSETGLGNQTGQGAASPLAGSGSGAVKSVPVDFDSVGTTARDASATQQQLSEHLPAPEATLGTHGSLIEGSASLADSSLPKEQAHNVVRPPRGPTLPDPESTRGTPAANHDLSSKISAAAPLPTAMKPGAVVPAAGTGALVTKDNSHLSIQVPPVDTVKASDILSSPSSTAQTATTPAPHEASTDTSPDHEGVQYVDSEEGKTESGRSNGQLQDVVQDSQSSRSDPAHSERRGVVNGVEAQLLGESAAATTAKQNVLLSATSGPSREAAENGLEHTAQEYESSVAPGSSSKPSAPLAEIRDSQESSPAEAMDIDGPHDHQNTKASEANEKRTEASTLAEHDIVRQPLSSVTPNTPTGSPRPSTSLTRQESQRHRDVSLAAKLKSRQRSGTPTVVFGKQQKRVTLDKTISKPRGKSSNLLSEDYFTPLFIQNFAQQSSKRVKHLDNLVHSAQKIVSTPDLQCAMLESQACKILKRVYHLQQADKWSLRQPKRCAEPTRNPSHWDTLIQEMKWMRTDFREERKWKRTVARNLALDCAEWVSADPEQRRALQVNASTPPKTFGLDAPDAQANDGPEKLPEEMQTVATPDLISTGDSPPDMDDIEDLPLTVAPSAIFAMRDNDVVFELQKTAASERLLEELPLYGLPLRLPQDDSTRPDFDPDAQWKRPALPLSKYVEGQQVLVNPGHPSRKSRYQYEEEESDDESPFSSLSGEKVILERENTNCALFVPEMAPIRDRAQAGQAFRPPSDSHMPPQNFYEHRLPSLWTMHEDDQLKALVREHSYNWALISSIISSKSLFASAHERRTPWECFERWTCLEGIPDMGKTPYFRVFQQRIDGAQKVIADQNQKAQQQAVSNGSLTPVVKRGPSTTRRVERRKSQKYLAMFDAMRKLAKKRETAQQKQQAAAAASAARKPADTAAPKNQLKTPRDYSIMRYERDQQLAEKMAQYAQRQQEANRRNQMIARGQGQPVAPGGGAQLPPQVAAQLAANPLASASRPNVPSQLAMPGQARPRVPMPAPANGVPGMQANMRGALVPPGAMNGMTPAEMQARAAQNMQMPNGQPDMRLVMQARLVQEQQRALAVLQQQQQGPQPQQTPQPQQPQQQGQQGQQGQQQSPQMSGGQASPHGIRPGMNGINQQNYMANAQAMMAPYAGANGAGMASPAPNGISTPGAGSPRGLATPQAQQIAAHQQQQLAAFASQMTPTQQASIVELERSFRAKNPNMSASDARNLAISNLANISRFQAMNAAAGGSPNHAFMSGMSGTSPHQYAQLLRAQQQQQQAAAGGTPQGSQHQRQPSAGSVTASK